MSEIWNENHLLRWRSKAVKVVQYFNWQVQKVKITYWYNNFKYYVLIVLIEINNYSVWR